MRIIVVLLFVIPQLALAQPAPPPAFPPLLVPADNPLTDAKINLGKVLFWDEQLSSTGTVACGTCHGLAAGGSDGRSAGNVLSINPGVDQTFNTADDVIGSPGVPQSNADGRYAWSPVFAYLDQVTGRASPPVINAAFAPELFWDGRAGSSFSDPVTGELLVSNGAALENQAVGPLLNDVEMSHMGQNWSELLSRLRTQTPLALSPEIPNDLLLWIDNRSYPQLFADTFGSSQITAGRIGLAMASYQRTLISDQTPLNDAALGNPAALSPQERAGQGVFATSNCNACHAGALLTNQQFRYIGVVPQNEDDGRFAVTGVQGDRGRFKVPSLLNVQLRAPFMHNGSLATLQEVIDFYDRGGDFDAPNKDPNVRPLNLSTQQKADLLAFLTRPLLDERVANQTGPFTAPVLYTESNRVPVVQTDGVPGSGGLVPDVIAIEPPLLGNPSFTVNVFDALGGAEATLIIDLADPGLGENLPAPEDALIYQTITLDESGVGLGRASVSLTLPSDPSLIDVPLFGRWYINDSAASNGVAVSGLIEFSLFDSLVENRDVLFESSFED